MIESMGWTKWTIVIALVGAVGCGAGQRNPRAVTTPAATATATSPVSAENNPPEPTKQNSRPSMLELADALPSDTLMVVLGHDLFALADKLDHTALIERFPQDYEELVEDMIDQMGVDLTTAEGLEEVGLDPHGPAGAAVIWPDQGAFGLLFTVASRSRLKRGAHRWESMAMEPEVSGDVLLLLSRNDPSFAIVVVGDAALVLSSDEGAAADAARRIAERQSGVLTSSAHFRQTMRGLPTDTDGLLYINPAQTLERSMGTLPIIPDLQGLGCALEVQRNSVECDLHVVLAENSTLDRIAQHGVKSPPGGPSIVRVLDRQPLFVFHTHLDPEVAAAELRNGLGAFWHMLGTELGVNLDSQIVPMIDGSLSLALELFDRGPRPKNLPTHEYWARDQPLTTVFVGLRNRSAAQQFLKQMVSAKHLVRSGRDYKNPQNTMGPYIGIRGDTLVITNEEKYLRSMGDPAQATGGWKWPTPNEEAPLLVGFGPATFFAMDGVGYYPGAATPRPGPAIAGPNRAKARVLEKEIAELEKQRDKLVAEFVEQQVENNELLATKGGMFWITLDRGESGLEGNVSYRVSEDSFGTALADLIDLNRGQIESQEDYYRQLGELDDEIHQKHRELEMLRTGGSATP